MPDNPVASATTGRSAGAGPGGAVRRRTVLRAGLAAATSTSALGLAGCRIRVGSPPADRPTPPAPEPSTDEQALIRGWQQADALAATYARAALVRPDVAGPLGQLAADHTAHVRVLQALTAGSTSAPASASASGSATASSTASSSPTTGAGQALTALTATSLLSQSERAAATRAQADLAAIGAQPARLLASVAACRAAHVALLARLPQSPPAPTKKSS